jgi:hypothetical protein
MSVAFIVVIITFCGMSYQCIQKYKNKRYTITLDTTVKVPDIKITPTENRNPAESKYPIKGPYTRYLDNDEPGKKVDYPHAVYGELPKDIDMSIES